MTPLVFDDPISSLDDKYEKAVVTRLITLASKRQIIVFTHRLTFYKDLQNQGDCKDVKYRSVEIFRTAQNAGKTKDLSVLCGNVKGRLNRIKDEKLHQAKKIYQEFGCCDEYLEKMTSLCTTIRVSVEDLVADTLLGDIVSRYRPDIQTKGKLNRLADITAEECNLIDCWMTKYSNIVHSKSGERCPETFDDSSDFSIAKIEYDLSEMIKLNADILARRK
jgi:wobble nucleotide-excising tRNase